MILTGDKIAKSTEVLALVSELVKKVMQLNSEIIGVQKPKAEFAAKYQEHMDQLSKLRGRPLLYPFIGSGAGRGPFVELEDGSVKLDLINGIGIHLFGHSHPRVIEAALRGALCDVVNQGNLEPNREYIEFSELLSFHAGKHSKLKHVWFSTCGTMANENALKIARQKHSPAKFIVAFKNAFAGRSTMMAEVTDNPGFKVGLPEYHEVLRIPFYEKNDPQSIEKSLQAFKAHAAKHPKEIATFIFEPMLGEGGYQAAPREFFVPLLEFAKSEGIAVWADEVQTFCRTGELFAFETLDIGKYIDICTIAKTAQLGATLYSEEYNPKPGLIAGTFSGTTVAMSTGMEMIKMLVSENYLGPKGRVLQIHSRFVAGIKKLNDSSCKNKAQDAGGMGLMVAFTPFEGKKEEIDSFMKKLFHNGVIGFTCGKGPYRSRFLIPACITDTEIDQALEIIERTLLEGP